MCYQKILHWDTPQWFTAACPSAEEANKLYFSLYSQNYDVYKIFLFKKKHLIWLIMKATKSTPWFVT